MSVFDERFEGTDLYYPRPSPMLVAYASQNLVEGPALDVGCGEGRNTLWLLENGLKVRAVDRSIIGIEKLHRIARDRSLTSGLTTQVIDLDCQYDLGSDYRLVIASTVLCHLRPEVASRVLNDLLVALRPGGVAYISVFTTEDPSFSRSNNMSETGTAVINHFRLNELLRELQARGMRIVRYFEGAERDDSHGPLHLHGVAKAIAIKER
jgi:tellurite methyltransferase